MLTCKNLRSFNQENHLETIPFDFSVDCSPCEFSYYTNLPLKLLTGFLEQRLNIKGHLYEVEDCYFDTHDRQLFKKDYSLRLREWKNKKSQFYYLLNVSWLMGKNSHPYPQYKINNVVVNAYNQKRAQNIKRLLKTLKSRNFLRITVIKKKSCVFELSPWKFSRYADNKKLTGIDRLRKTSSGIWKTTDVGLRVEVDLLATPLNNCYAVVEIEFDRKRLSRAQEVNQMLGRKFGKNLYSKNNNKIFDILKKHGKQDQNKTV